MPYSILGLHGWAGSGKTTSKNALKNYIKDRESKNNLLSMHERTEVHCFAFADPLKKICIAMFGDYPNWYGTQEQKDAPIPGINNLFPAIKTFRDAMKFIGTNVFREHVDKDIWVKLMRVKVEQHVVPSKFQIFILDDVRFPNEAEYILAEPNNAVLRIKKQGQVSTDAHASEQVLESHHLTKTLEFKTAADIEQSAGYLYAIVTGAAR